MWIGSLSNAFYKKYKILLLEDLNDELNRREGNLFNESKANSGIGTAVLSEYLNIIISKTLGDHHTVFQAEYT